jgi:hypothetical protein
MHIIPLYDSRLDVVRRVFLGKMCVCVKRKEKHGKILYLVLCKGKWLKVIKCIIYLYLY